MAYLVESVLYKLPTKVVGAIVNARHELHCKAGWASETPIHSSNLQLRRATGEMPEYTMVILVNTHS
jgi:hypothetical protein